MNSFFHKAIHIPQWLLSIMKELTNLEKYGTFWIEEDTGQPRLPVMWLFLIKDDGIFKSRLVGRGDMMKEGVHFMPGETYCGNVMASTIKLALKIAATYRLDMIGGDIEGVYLITRTKTPIAIHTPRGYKCPPGCVFMVYGNLYGLATAGNTFSESFDERLNVHSHHHHCRHTKKGFSSFSVGCCLSVCAALRAHTELSVCASSQSALRAVRLCKAHRRVHFVNAHAL